MRKRLAVEGLHGGARTAPRRCWPPPARWAGRAPPRARSSGPTARRPAHAGRSSRAISWPSAPLPASKPLHSHSSRRVGGQRREHARAAPAIGVAMTSRPSRAWRQRGVEVGADLQRRGQRHLGQVALVAALRAHRAACARVARPQQHVVARRRAPTASAVPQAPAPSTAEVHARRRAPARRPAQFDAGDDARRAVAVLRRGLRLLRFEHGLEVDFGQQDRREAGARADVGDDGAQVGVDHLRAGDADDALHLLFGHVADLEDAGLLGLDQEQRLVLDLGRDGGGDA